MMILFVCFWHAMIGENLLMLGVKLRIESSCTDGREYDICDLHGSIYVHFLFFLLTYILDKFKDVYSKQSFMKIDPKMMK